MSDYKPVRLLDPLDSEPFKGDGPGNDCMCSVSGVVGKPFEKASDDEQDINRRCPDHFHYWSFGEEGPRRYPPETFEALVAGLPPLETTALATSDEDPGDFFEVFHAATAFMMEKEIERRCAEKEVEIRAEERAKWEVREKESEAAAEAWKETAAMYGRNADYYRGLLVQIGEGFGVAARTSDDGSVQADVLVAKVPELVADLRRGCENTVSGTVCVNRAFWEQMKADRMALREAAKAAVAAHVAADAIAWVRDREIVAFREAMAALRKAVGE